MLPPVTGARGKRARHQALSERAKSKLESFIRDRIPAK
jgi:hypothetical protein